MNPQRRHGLRVLAALGLASGAPPAWRQALALPPSTLPPQTLPPVLHPGEPLVFPHDHGAHPAFRTEWWYLTGVLHARPLDARPPATGAMALATPPSHGFQITFFRSRVDAAADSPSRFAARQLVFVHTALTDLAGGRLLHDERIARTGFGLAEAAEGDTRVHLRDWMLQREGPVTQGVYRSRIRAQGFGFDLRFAQTQPTLLQGQAGFSQKAPGLVHASRYYSHPQLTVSGQFQQGDRRFAASGTAWLDHEWSEALLHPEAEGWDWMGINLLDGGALTAFRLRRRDGSALWHGGSLRRLGQPDRIFGPEELRLTPVRRWTSPATGASYPVAWTIEWPGARHTLQASLDNQELDSRNSTGNVYWEGLSELRDSQGRLAGRGYLEMTGYTARLAL